MKRLQLFIFLLFTAYVSVFSQDVTAVDRWSAESFVALANEEQLNLFGVEYGTRLNYNIFDRFGASVSLGSFQSLWAKKRWKVRNVSRMLLSVNVFGDIIKSENFVSIPHCRPMADGNKSARVRRFRRLPNQLLAYIIARLLGQL